MPNNAASQMDTIEFRRSTWKTAGMLLGSLALTAGAVLGILHPIAPEPGSWEEYLGVSMPWLGFAMFGATTLLFLYQLINIRSPLVRLTPEGIEGLQSPRIAMPWSAVTGFGTWQSPGVKWLVVGVTKEAEAKLSDMDRRRLSSNRMIGIDGVAIITTGLAVSDKALLEACEKARTAWRIAASGAPNKPSASEAASRPLMSYIILGPGGFTDNSKIIEAMRRRVPDFEAYDPPKNGGALVAVPGEKLTTVMFMDFQNPLGENESFIVSAWWWPDVRGRLAERRAHVIISTSSDGNDPKAGYMRLAALTAAVIETHPSAIGVIWDAADAVWPAHIFLTTVEQAAGKLPIPIFISVKLGTDTQFPRPDKSPAWLAMTYGMAALGMMELEVRGYDGEPKDLVELLLDLASYLLEKGPTIGDGDTFNHGDNRAMRITHEASTLDQGKRVYRLHTNPVTLH